MLNFFIILVLSVFFMSIILESVTWGVFGWFAKESDLDSFFGKHFTDYELNTVNPKMFYGRNGDLPYIAPLPFSLITGKWYIKDNGRIPYWSKWHKRLNDAHESMMMKYEKPKKLSEL